MKKAIRLFGIAAAIFLTTVILSMSASADGVDSFYIDGGLSPQKGSDTVKLISFEGDNAFYLVIPSTADDSSLCVHFDGTMTVDGKALTSGETTDAFADKTAVKALLNGKALDIKVFRSELPAIFVSTESGSFEAIEADKSHKEGGTIVVADSDGTYYDGKLKHIKGRGNSTWSFEKKPYNLKLDKAADLFGMGKAKSWCLLANYLDHSFIRNIVVSEIANILDMGFAPEGQQVALYRNGEYAGVYTLSEKIEIDTERVNIANLTKLTEKANGVDELDGFPRAGDIDLMTPGSYKYCDIPLDPEDISGGYLLEVDYGYRYAEEISGFVTDRGFSIVLKEPEIASKAQVEYIRACYQDFEDAIFSADGFNSKGKHYSEYADMESLAKMFILQDLSLNCDAGMSSLYFYKDTNGLLTAGPVWDFDIALANDHPESIPMRNGYSLLDPASTYVRDGKLESTKACDGILNALYDHEDFEKLVYKLWTEKLMPEKDRIISCVTELAPINANDAAINSVVCGVYDNELDARLEYMKDCDKVASFLEARCEFLNGYYAEDHSAVPINGTEPPPARPSIIGGFLEYISRFIAGILAFLQSILEGGFIFGK